MQTSMKFDVWVAQEFHDLVVQSVRLYRHVCRQTFSIDVLMATACGNIVMKKGKYEMKPDNAITQKCQELMFQGKQGGSSQTYSMREFVRNELSPTWLSFVWDSVHRDVNSKWKAPDTEIAKVKRGWLTMQGARNFPKFNKIGIGCPQKTAHPDFLNKSVEIKWDHDIGPVEFHLSKLDGSRYGVWNRLRDKVPGWDPGTVYISEKDNKLFLIISYGRPDPIKEIDPKKIMTVRVNEGEIENYITASCEEKVFYAEKIDITDALNFVDRIEIIQQRYEKQKSSIKWNRPMRRVVQQKVHHQTLKRRNGTMLYNHLWTRRLINHAIRTGCGTIDLEVPKLTMEGRSWGWYQFTTFLEYKINEIGGMLLVPEEEEKSASG